MIALCACGCGLPTTIPTRTISCRGRFKGVPMRYLRGHNPKYMVEFNLRPVRKQIASREKAVRL